MSIPVEPDPVEVTLIFPPAPLPVAATLIPLGATVTLFCPETLILPPLTVPVFVAISCSETLPVPNDRALTALAFIVPAGPEPVLLALMTAAPEAVRLIRKTPSANFPYKIVPHQKVMNEYNPHEYPLRYAGEENINIDERKVPFEFRHLIKYAKKWSIGDDVLRSLVMEQTPIEEKQDLVNSVAPYLDAILDWTVKHEFDLNLSDEVRISVLLCAPYWEAELDLIKKDAGR